MTGASKIFSFSSRIGLQLFSILSTMELVFLRSFLVVEACKQLMNSLNYQWTGLIDRRFPPLQREIRSVAFPCFFSIQAVCWMVLRARTTRLDTGVITSWPVPFCSYIFMRCHNSLFALICTEGGGCFVDIHLFQSL